MVRSFLLWWIGDTGIVYTGYRYFGIWGGEVQYEYSMIFLKVNGESGKDWGICGDFSEKGISTSGYDIGRVLV